MKKVKAAQVARTTAEKLAVVDIFVGEGLGELLGPEIIWTTKIVAALEMLVAGNPYNEALQRAADKPIAFVTWLRRDSGPDGQRAVKKLLTESPNGNARTVSSGRALGTITGQDNGRPKHIL